MFLVMMLGWMKMKMRRWLRFKGEAIACTGGKEGHFIPKVTRMGEKGHLGVLWNGEKEKESFVMRMLSKGINLWELALGILFFFFFLGRNRGLLLLLLFFALGMKRATSNYNVELIAPCAVCSSERQ